MRKSNHLTKLSDARVIELLSTGRYTNQDIGDIVGCSEATVRRAAHRASRHLITSELPIELEKPLVLTDFDGMVTADWHVPLYNPFLVNQMIERAGSLGLRKLLIGGDFFNFDALSQYDPKQHDAGLDIEKAEASFVIRTLAESFDEIIIIWGNHDARFHRTLGYKMQFDHAMRMMLGDAGNDALSKVRISNLDHLWIEFTNAPESVSKWRVCHPATYSRVPLSTPRTLAAKYNANVICAHAHHAAIGFATDGQKTVVEIGGMFDQYKTSYLQRSTTFPEWTPGYGWFKDGRFHLTTPAWEM